jgi:hypothetical protein
MLTENDFSAANWNTLRETQYLAGFATLLAGAVVWVGSRSRAVSIRHRETASNVPLINDLTG